MPLIGTLGVARQISTLFLGRATTLRSLQSSEPLETPFQIAVSSNEAAESSPLLVFDDCAALMICPSSSRTVPASA
jgi:hypothetical protein